MMHDDSDMKKKKKSVSTQNVLCVCDNVNLLKFHAGEAGSRESVLHHEVYDQHGVFPSPTNPPVSWVSIPDVHEARALPSR